MVTNDVVCANLFFPILYHPRRLARSYYYDFCHPSYYAKVEGFVTNRRWRPKILHRHIRVLRELLILPAILNIQLLSNVLKNFIWTRVDVKNILMFTRSVRKRRGKLDWNEIRVGPYSLEIFIRF